MLDYLTLEGHLDYCNRDYSTLLHYIIMHAESIHGEREVYYSHVNKRYRISCRAMDTMLLLTANILKAKASDDGILHTYNIILSEFITNEQKRDADHPMSWDYYVEKFQKVLKSQLVNVHMDILTSYINMLKKHKAYIYAEWRNYQ